MTRTITNHDDLIDSRDVIARIEELEEAKAADPEFVLTQPEEHLELTELLLLAEQGELIEDWKYGVSLVRDSYFVKYAQELADELGENVSAAKWPYTCIDWDAAAEELQQDYTCVDFNGVTYWVR